MFVKVEVGSIGWCLFGRKLAGVEPASLHHLLLLKVGFLINTNAL